MRRTESNWREGMGVTVLKGMCERKRCGEMLFYLLYVFIYQNDQITKNVREAENVSSWKGLLRSSCPVPSFLEIRKQGPQKLSSLLHKFWQSAEKWRMRARIPGSFHDTLKLSLKLGTCGAHFIMFSGAEIAQILEWSNFHI